MSRVTTTDLYEVTMALSYLKEGMDRPATCSLFVRDLPPGRGFLVSAELESALDYLTDFRITTADAEDFAAVLHRPSRELAPLVGLTFHGEVHAVPGLRPVRAVRPLSYPPRPSPSAPPAATLKMYPNRGPP